mgnify:CR=1 FL=1
MRLKVPEGEVAKDYRAVGTLLPVRVPMADVHVAVDGRRSRCGFAAD